MLKYHTPSYFLEYIYTCEFMLILIGPRCLKIYIRKLFVDWIKGRLKVSFKVNILYFICNLWQRSKLIKIQFPANPTSATLCLHPQQFLGKKQEKYLWVILIKYYVTLVHAVQKLS